MTFEKCDFDIPDIINVAGVTFNNRQKIIPLLVQNQEIKLKRDYQNKSDKNAIMVLAKIDNEIKQIGWVPKEFSFKIAQAIDNGIKYKVKVFDILGDGVQFSYGVKIKIE